MDIGTKLKAARIAAGLTQEQAAELLGVSRQTMSHWENNKTYPDIVRVIKMSDLYAVSLDHLLKEKKAEETPMPDYIEYLEESTNTVRSRARLSKVILIAAYLLIWAFAIITFWLFTSGSDAMGFSLVFLWIILPVTTFVLSIVIGRNDYLGKWKWFSSLAFGVMYMLAEYATFRTANMVTFHKLNPPSWGMLLAGAVISVIGLGIGLAAGRRSRKR